MVHPLLLPLVKLAPHALKALGAAEAYGWHRVYRRIGEGTRRLPQSQQQTVRSLVKDAIRFPLKSYELLTNHELTAFAHAYAVRIIAENNLKVPPFFVWAAKLVVKNSPLAKVHQAVEMLERQRQKKKTT